MVLVPLIICAAYGSRFTSCTRCSDRLFSAWPTDGIVIKAVDSKLQRRLGSGGQRAFGHSQ